MRSLSMIADDTAVCWSLQICPHGMPDNSVLKSEAKACIAQTQGRTLSSSKSFAECNGCAYDEQQMSTPCQKACSTMNTG